MLSQPLDNVEYFLDSIRLDLQIVRRDAQQWQWDCMSLGIHKGYTAKNILNSLHLCYISSFITENSEKNENSMCIFKELKIFKI